MLDCNLFSALLDDPGARVPPKTCSILKTAQVVVKPFRDPCPSFACFFDCPGTLSACCALASENLEDVHPVKLYSTRYMKNILSLTGMHFFPCSVLLVECLTK